eukprot:jgi/Mesvir1/5832/Mv00627-RA.1
MSSLAFTTAALPVARSVSSGAKNSLECHRPVSHAIPRSRQQNFPLSLNCGQDQPSAFLSCSRRGARTAHRLSVTRASCRDGNADGSNGRCRGNSGSDDIPTEDSLTQEFASLLRDKKLTASQAEGRDTSNWWRSIDHVCILLFNVGTANEGIYCVQTRNRYGLPVNVIQAFECREDAERFGVLLDASMDMHAVVEVISTQHLSEFCDEAAYDCTVIRRGEFCVPPERTLDMTDLERATRLREGNIKVLDDFDYDVRSDGTRFVDLGHFTFCTEDEDLLGDEIVLDGGHLDDICARLERQFQSGGPQ